jgi:tight adherence protein C
MISEIWLWARSEHVSIAAVVLGSATFAAALGVWAARVKPHDPALLGRVAARRRDALKRSRLLRVAEFALRWATGALWSVPSLRARAEGYREWQRRQLNLAGNPWALGPDEFPVVVFLMVLGTCGAGAAAGLGANLVGFLAALALIVPFVRVASVAESRKRAAGRETPRLMDLVALCMSSGMDLVRALEQISAGDRGVLAKEMDYLLGTLQMGQTRRDALLALFEALPAPEVGDFCRAVIQAEAKGASVRDALLQQAVMSRGKRSVRAEELAARAAVLMLGPTLMLMVCIFLMILGPLIAGGVGF